MRNPFAPGAGRRPAAAGRDRELGVFEVMLERVTRGAGVGKTVLLGKLRLMAMRLA